MEAVLLAGHGSLREASGEAMLRLARLLRGRGVAPIVAAGFLNFSSPPFAKAVRDCAEAGATRLVVQPYLLIDGFYARRLLPRLVAEAQVAHPALRLQSAAPLGFHQALVELVAERAGLSQGNPLTGLLIMAHGTPFPRANAPLELLAAAAADRFPNVAVGYLESNEPSIPAAAADLVGRGARRVVALPYFLHLGEHVAADLPRQVRRLRELHPGVRFRLAGHLGYDPRIAAVIEDRVAEARAASLRGPGVSRPGVFVELG